MKQQSRFYNQEQGSCFRLLKRTMRLILFICFLGASSLSGNSSYSQEMTFSLHLKNKPLSELFNQIESKSNYVFITSDEVKKDLNKEINIDIDKGSIDEVLGTIMTEASLKYIVTGRQITVFKKETTADNAFGPSPQQNSTSINVQGTVVDSKGIPLIGVSIREEGTSNGTITDVDGNYSIKVNPKASIQFSYIGFGTIVKPVNGKSTMNMKMTESSDSFDDIVVVGYGYQKKKHLTGSVSQINSDEILKAPMANLTNMLSGKLPGLTTMQESGIPGGDQAFVAIRGYSTTGNASPLLLVDGVERMIHTVNPEDVESVTILKDAAAGAVYGVRAANGVILVTTKKGQEGKASISYSGSVTFSLNTRFPELLNGPDYAHWYNKASALDGKGYTYDADALTKIQNGDPEGVYGNTDWYDLLFKDYGLNHQHTLSISGGSDKVNYYTSVGFLNQDGIVDADVTYKRFNVRSNIDVKITKDLSMAVNLSGFREDTSWPGISLSSQAYMNPINQAIFAAPIIPSTYNGKDVGWLTPGSDEIQNPIAAARNSGYIKKARKSFEGNMRLTYQMPFLEGLKASFFFSYDDGYTENQNLLKNYNMMVYDFADKAYEERPATAIGKGSFSKSASTGSSNIIRPSLEYNQKFGKHTVGALVLYEYFKMKGNTMTATKLHPVFNSPVDLTWMTEAGLSQPTGSYDRNAMIGYVSRLNYAYENKYLAEVAFRADASPKFAKSERWGYFPSISVGWVVSEEEFFKGARNSIDFLKLRASAGELGSDDTDPYLYRTTFSMTAPNYAYAFGSGGTTKPHYGLYINNVIPSIVTWAKTRTYNVGLNFEAWNGLLGAEFDAFYMVTRDLLEFTGGLYPPSLGGNFQTITNSGKLDNRGIELKLTHRNKIGEVGYNLTGSLAWARNKMLSQYQGDGVPWFRNQIGRPQGAIYGFKAIGLYQTQEQLDSRPIGPGGVQRLGDLMYEDINGDGKLNSDDYVKISRGSLPQINYSFNLNLSYKDFEFSTLWQGAANYDIMLQNSYYSGVVDNTMFTRPFYQGGNTPYYLVEGAWTPENTNAAYPRLSTEWNANNGWPSSWWVVNGAYLRLKNVQLSYKVPKSFTDKISPSISNLRIYVAGTNLMTLNDFKYIDPEMRTINNGYYPQQKTYSFGLNLSF